MRVARHDPRVFVGHVLQRVLKHLDQLSHFSGLLLDVELHVHVALVIAAACGVQLFAQLAHTADEIELHKGVNVLIVAGEYQCAAAVIAQDAFQAFGERLAFVFRQQTYPHLHGHMGDAALNIRLDHPREAVPGNGQTVKTVRPHPRGICRPTDSFHKPWPCMVHPRFQKMI